MSEKRNPILMMKAEEVDYKPEKKIDPELDFGAISAAIKSELEWNGVINKEYPCNFIGLISSLMPMDQQRIGDLYYCDKPFYDYDTLWQEGLWVTVSKITREAESGRRKIYYMEVSEEQIIEEIRKMALDLLIASGGNKEFVEALKRL